MAADGMAVRPQGLGGAEVQLGAGGVDQIIVGEPVLLARALGRRVFDDDIRRGVVRVAFGMNRNGFGLMEGDPDLLIDFGQVEGDLLLGHLTDANPDVGGNPVPFGVRGTDDDLIGAGRICAANG
ncbi:hypothetical protein [Rhodoblastus sp.]